MNKGLIGAIKLTMIFLVLLISLFFIYNFVLPTAAEISTTIWTTDVYGNPKTDFAPEETVYIHGSNFLANNNVDVSITRPDGTIDLGNSFSDEFGNFNYDYILDGITGTYYVTATDGTNTAETTFVDTPAIQYNLEQWADKPPANWQNGDLNPTNSQYHEGEAVPFHLLIDNPGVSNISVRIRYNAKRSGINAYDFLVSYDRDRLPDVPSGIPNTTSIPYDSRIPFSHDSGVFTLYNGTIVSVSQVQNTSSGPSDTTYDKYYDLTLLPTGGNMVLLWGGHLASEADWGSGMGASSISGAPFHMHFGKMPGDTSSQDRSIQPAAILPPQLCEENENETDFLYESKPNYAYVDSSTTNVSYKLCNSTQISVDTSSGIHYIYMNWNSNQINISDYDGAVYFDLLLYHYEDSTLVKVQLKNQTGSWIDVCDPPESGSFIWSTCNLMPYLNILKNVSIIELRLVAWQSGTCHEYLGCAKLKVKLYKCQPQEFCGNGVVTPPEQCELPNTNNNPFCIQTTTECLGKKLGQRDAYGNCDNICGCVNDPFDYSCVQGQCGASCDENSDCQNKCIDNIRYFNGNCDSNSCDCSYSTEDCNKDGCYAYDSGCEDRDYFCQIGGCNYTFSNRHTDFNDSSVYYCSDGAIRANETFHDFYCNGHCSDHTSQINDRLIEDCNLHDGWYNTTNTRWINDTQCTEKEQVQQEYRDYTCSPPANCTYTVNNTLWINTTNTRNKPNGTPCNDGLFCTNPDTCTGGVCGGPSRDCSAFNLSEIAQCNWIPDGFSYTFDYSPGFTSVCDETLDECTEGSQNLTHTCADSNSSDGGPVIPVSDGIRNCTAECDYFGIECQNKCIGNVSYYNGDCESCFCSYDTEDCSNHNGCYAYDSGCEDRDYFCQISGCNYTFSNRNVDYYSNYSNYCSDDTIRSNRTLHNFYCNDHCSDHTSFVNDSLIQNCSLQNGWYNTTNTRWINDTQCTEKEQLQQEYRDFTCVEPSITCNYTVMDTRWINTTNIRDKPNGTPCNDGLFCTNPDTCTGGICGGPSRDCSAFNLSEIAACDWIPDNFLPTFDYSPGFTSLCDETLDECTEGSYNLTHTCADSNSSDGGPVIPVSDGIRSCTAECDGYGIECQDKCIGNVSYYAGNCNSDPSSCFCSYSTENCDDKDHCYAYETGCEMRDYFCQIGGCNYTFSNRNVDYNDTSVNYCSDSTIRANRTFHDFYCNGHCSDHTSQINDRLIEDCNLYDNWYNTTNTRWVNLTRCTEKEQLQQEFKDYTCSPPANCTFSVNDTQWIDTGNTRNKTDVPPLNPPNKTIGEPKTKCSEGEWCDWKITTLTSIVLTCEEGKVKWRYELDGDWNDWHVDDSPVTIYFPEESNHTLEAYCIDECSESIHDIEKFKVEGTAFEIPLYKKWNLISVPFALANESISEVFKNISDKIVSVWTYDNGNWYVWIPSLGGTLTEIKPGWGYWVIAKEDTKLLISGSLFSPITTPPSKELQNGWNLIGYYGTEWQTYELEEDSSCGYINPVYGNYVYCSLNSLIDTQRGFPRWSSLWGYDNCGEDVAYWHQLESCTGEHWSDNRMYAGKGYWIEMDVRDSYAPATNCIWDEDLHCSFPTI